MAKVGSPCYEITANERGETSTMLASLNAAGDYGPQLPHPNPSSSHSPGSSPSPCPGNTLLFPFTNPPQCLVKSTPCFVDLVDIPIHERATTSKRSKPPSFHLTSDTHFEYVASKTKGKGKQTTQKAKCQKAQRKEDTCVVCLQQYGNTEDPKKAEEWISCAICQQWFHDFCGEDNGVIDDGNSFTCLFLV